MYKAIGYDKKAGIMHVWDDELGHSQKLQNNTPIRKYFKEEQVLNYIYE